MSEAAGRITSREVVGAAQNDESGRYRGRFCLALQAIHVVPHARAPGGFGSVVIRASYFECRSGAGAGMNLMEHTRWAGVFCLAISAMGCSPAPAPPPTDARPHADSQPKQPASTAAPRKKPINRWKTPPPEAVHVAEAEYLTPDADVADLLETKPPPIPVVHAASGRVALVDRESLVPVERLARPSLGLAGLRIDPANATLVNQSFAVQVSVLSIEDPAQRIDVLPPADALFSDVFFSPDGSRLAVTIVRSDRIDLGLIDLETGDLRELTSAGPLNAIWGPPCTWVENDRLLCARRGDQSPPPRAEVGPNIQELVSGSAPVLTFANLLRDPNDDALFAHHGSVNLAFVSHEGEVSIALVPPGLIRGHLLAPDHEWIVVERLKPPFPRIVPVDRFPRDVELHHIGFPEQTRSIHIGNADSVQTRAVGQGPRMFRWVPDESTTLAYVERSYGKDRRLIDTVQWFDASSQDDPEVAKGTFVDVEAFEYTTKGTGLVVDRTTSGRRQLYRLGDRPRILVDAETEEARADLDYAMRQNGNRGAILEHRGRIFLPGEEATPRGTRSSLRGLDLKSGKTHPVFTSGKSVHERVVAVLNPRRKDLLIAHESATSPRSFVRLRGNERVEVNAASPPPPALSGVERRLIRYERADGVKLSAVLYLPAARQEGERLPVVFWIYPREFSDESYASQAMENPHRYMDIRGPSHFAFLLRGYAVLDSPSIPIVGSRQSAQRSYVEQLVASAKAAVDHLVEAGIADPSRIAVVGRSYGAFSVANLMAHSDLFRVAVAMSGAYNRTLTPFGFQNEVRSFWQRQDAYVSMSPFFFADDIKRPMLLIHGENDENPGTPAVQSERFFAALAGNGVPSRYVSLPFEGHVYRGRESVLHIVAEMLRWFDRHGMQPALPSPASPP